MRIEPYGLLELTRRRVYLAGVHQGHAQVVSYLDVAGIALEMEPELGDCIRDPAQTEEEEAEVPALVAERIGPKPQRALEVLDRFGVVAAGIERRRQVSVALGAGGIDFESRSPERVFVAPTLDLTPGERRETGDRERGRCEEKSGEGRPEPSAPRRAGDDRHPGAREDRPAETRQIAVPARDELRPRVDEPADRRHHHAVARPERQSCRPAPPKPPQHRRDDRAAAAPH